ncbi:MAG: hypothetical protein WDZ45_01775, partial [Flavobacteriaceae bacterium]
LYQLSYFRVLNTRVSGYLLNMFSEHQYNINTKRNLHQPSADGALPTELFSRFEYSRKRVSRQ